MSDPINIKFPLTKGSQGAFDTNVDTLSAVTDDLRILILTNHGERPIHYDFGANLRKVIFEFRGSALRQAIKDSIEVAVEKWMPFVNLLDITVEESTVNPTLRDNEVLVKIKFSIGNIDVNTILVQRIRA